MGNTGKDTSRKNLRLILVFIDILFQVTVSHIPLCRPEIGLAVAVPVKERDIF
jgi:hypothetical protein